MLLDAARRGARPPRLARVLLACGIGATLFANVLAGLAYGPLGAAVAAWPALALVGSYELLMLLIRSGTRVPAQVPSIRALKDALRVGQPVAERVQAYLQRPLIHVGPRGGIGFLGLVAARGSLQRGDQ